MRVYVTAYPFPDWNEGDRPMDVDDFRVNHEIFEGDTTVEALLRCLEYYGYVNKDNYMQNIDTLGNDVKSVLKFVGVDETWNGINGDGGDFILYIHDDDGNCIFEDEKGLSYWKATFK